MSELYQTNSEKENGAGLPTLIVLVVLIVALIAQGGTNGGKPRQNTNLPSTINLDRHPSRHRPPSEARRRNAQEDERKRNVQDEMTRDIAPRTKN